MKSGTLTFLTTVILLGVLAIPVRLAAQNTSSEIITFDAPGADKTAGSGDGTFPDSVNGAGAITGHYADGNGTYRGFLRSSEGEFTTFDAPGASSATGDGTFPRSISAGGAIIGSYSDWSEANKELNRGFMRSPEGRFTTFQAPGADTTAGVGNGTFPDSISDAGAITGHYTDARNVNHGFLRIP